MTLAAASSCTSVKERSPEAPPTCALVLSATGVRVPSANTRCGRSRRLSASGPRPLPAAAHVHAGLPASSYLAVSSLVASVALGRQHLSGWITLHGRKVSQ